MGHHGYGHGGKRQPLQHHQQRRGNLSHGHLCGQLGGNPPGQQLHQLLPDRQRKRQLPDPAAPGRPHRLHRGGRDADGGLRRRRQAGNGGGGRHVRRDHPRGLLARAGGNRHLRQLQRGNQVRRGRGH